MEIKFNLSRARLNSVFLIILANIKIQWLTVLYLAGESLWNGIYFISRKCYIILKMWNESAFFISFAYAIIFLLFYCSIAYMFYFILYNNIYII